ncbi:hypothetical protein [Knoellia remsis]|nr:hypothetical protein [Knoellia remsis]
MAASVWGNCFAAELEANLHLAGVSARPRRVKIFVAMALVVALNTFVVVVVPVVAVTVAAGRGAGSLDLAEFALFLCTGFVSVCLGTAVGWGRSRTTALIWVVPMVVFPVLVYFGPRLSGRDLVLALSPTAAPLVMSPRAYSSPVESGISAAVLAMVALSTLAVLRARPLALRERTPHQDRGSGRSSGSEPSSRSRRVAPWAALVPVVVIAASPVFLERLPVWARYSTGVQEARGTSATATLARFLDLAAQGDWLAADSLTVRGQASAVLGGLPENFAQRTATAPLEMVSSANVASAEVMIRARGQVFFACMTHPRRQWMVVKVGVQRCD